MSMMAPVQPIRFQRAMVFVDGTNLHYRMQTARLALAQGLNQIIDRHLSGRQVVRSYLYTIQEHLDAAKQVHGEFFTEGVRVILGHGVPTGDGNVREKGVDALLVADLIYHAASKNYDYALLVSVDTDFVEALRRVDDFGCRTGVLAVCSDIPPRLRVAADECKIITVDEMLELKQATRVA